MAGPPCKCHQSPKNLREKPPVRKIGSQWSDTAAVIPSNSILGFFWNNKLWKERRRASLCWCGDGRNLDQQRQDWLGRLVAGSPGTQANSKLQAWGRLTWASSGDRLTVRLKAAVRGQLEEGQLVSKHLLQFWTFLEASKPLFSLNAVGLWTVHTEFYEWWWGKGVVRPGWNMAAWLSCAVSRGGNVEAEGGDRPVVTKVKADLHADPRKPGLQGRDSSWIFPSLETTHTPHVHLHQGPTRSLWLKYILFTQLTHKSNVVCF